jgi:hypothetical protein
MERREFIRGLCSGIAAWPLAASAQQGGELRRIGVLGADATVWKPWMAAFVTRLRERGWAEGSNIAIVSVRSPPNSFAKTSMSSLPMAAP